MPYGFMLYALWLMPYGLLTSCCMPYGFMVYALWVYGLCPMVYGSCPMGLCSMGLCPMVYSHHVVCPMGLWFMLYGLLTASLRSSSTPNLPPKPFLWSVCEAWSSVCPLSSQPRADSSTLSVSTPNLPPKPCENNEKAKLEAG